MKHLIILSLCFLFLSACKNNEKPYSVTFKNEKDKLSYVLGAINAKTIVNSGTEAFNKLDKDLVLKGFNQNLNGTPAQDCLNKLHLNWSQVAAMGDDWPDLPMLMPAAISFAPAQSHVEVLKRVHHICSAPAGNGAVREACDSVLQATGHYQALLNKWLV
jgi:3-deoxy-D-manno-octulosonate 8-phosphate phosphatase KdsC-like HAD superfamily phosphatase